MKVEVYKNLHTGTLSVREAGGKVFGHPRWYNVLNPTFVVQPAGRERVLREQRKNVHAFVRGEVPHPLQLEDFEGFFGWRQASYNPYKAPHFFDKETDSPIHSAAHAVVTCDRGVFYKE